MSNWTGAGIAIAGLGIGAGLIGWQSPGAGTGAMFFVMMSTMFIAMGVGE